MNEQQSRRKNSLLDELYNAFHQQVASKAYAQAEIIMQQILEVPGQPPEQYLYLPAGFYEQWGDAETRSPDVAIRCYKEARNYRYRIGSMATGSGEGLEAMSHVNRINRKIEKLK